MADDPILDIETQFMGIMRKIEHVAAQFLGLMHHDASGARNEPAHPGRELDFHAGIGLQHAVEAGRQVAACAVHTVRSSDSVWLAHRIGSKLRKAPTLQLVADRANMGKRYRIAENVQDRMLSGLPGRKGTTSAVMMSPRFRRFDPW